MTKRKRYFEIEDETYVANVRSLAASRGGRGVALSLGGLLGLAPRRARYSAKLSVGLTVGLANFIDERHGDAVIGSGLTAEQKIRRRDVVNEVKRLRIAQVGKDVAGATITHAEGVFEGGSEKSVVVEFDYIRSDREPTPEVFVRNVAELAERAASAFAQKEVLIAWQLGRRAETQRASPRGLPPPGRRLNAWLARR